MRSERTWTRSTRREAGGARLERDCRSCTQRRHHVRVGMARACLEAEEVRV